MEEIPTLFDNYYVRAFKQLHHCNTLIHCVSKKTGPLQKVGINSVSFPNIKNLKYTFRRELHSE